MEIPKSHPRYKSLKIRHKLIEGFKKGYVTEAGLIAHGRGECFDYLIGEKTIEEAKKAEECAVAMFLLAKSPIISINGNASALCGREICKLAKILNCPIEINLFYYSKIREKKIEELLKKYYHKIETEKKFKIPNLESKRANVSERFYNADVVLVPLEDGDRTEALVKMNKKIIAIDLNPLSRTSQKATITIVNNIVRAIPEMIKIAKEMKKKIEKGELKKEELEQIIGNFNNKENLDKIINKIRTSNLITTSNF